jgi:DNA (cytosine-5)-methyltransferase 1
VPSSARPSLVSLFSGAGGGDIGLERAGWHTVAATDIEADCLATLRASQSALIPISDRPGFNYLAGTRLIEANIADLRAADFRPDGARSTWRPDLLAGGPPCQPWSSAGLQKGLYDPRGRLFEHMVRLTDELRPRLILFENVRGLLTAVGPSGRPGEALEYLRSHFEELGYATNFATVNAADYGAPQRRVRLMMLASCDRALPSFPLPTHSRRPVAGLKPWVSLGELLDALGQPAEADIARPSAARAVEMATLRPGTGLRTGGRVEANRPGGHWGYRQDCFVADTSLPSRTIRAATTPDFVHMEDGSLRRLTWRECAALQGFPTDWSFQGTVASKFRQIGNAIQTDVATVVGAELLRALTVRLRAKPDSADWPAEFGRRVRYTEAEHRVNGSLRVRVRAQVGL